MIVSDPAPAPAPAASQGGPSPALRALVVYLRPAARASLLTTLANLGVFVTEQPGTASLPGVSADFGVLVAAGPEDAAVAAGLARRLPGGVIAVLPEGAHPAAFTAAGASAVLRDGELPAALTANIARMAFAARRARAGYVPARGAPRVFADLEFIAEPPQLRNGARALALSRSERDVLATLLATRGRPVPHSALEQAAAGDDLAHPGLLKAVVLRLRRKVTDLGGDAELLATIRGFGYTLRG
ncbi:MAG: winged helix-turn-helix domain-containing protein [Dehalococcoidia bacterium]|nr:winged helix-turn-helix domain-containing protein [Dehalococcoidia bacterium]